MKNKAKKISIISVLSAMSICLSYLANFTLPFLTFFKLDFSDIPSFIASMLFGEIYGLSILFITSIIRIGDIATFTSFLMKMSSSISIMFLGIYKRTNKYFYLLCLLSAITVVIVRLPLSYDLWINFYKVPEEVFFHKMRPPIIILTLSRTLFNMAISNFLYNHLKNKISNTYQLLD